MGIGKFSPFKGHGSDETDQRQVDDLTGEESVSCGEQWSCDGPSSKLKAIISGLNSGICLVDDKCKISQVNPYFLELMSMRESDVLGKEPWDLYDEPFCDVVRDVIDDFRSCSNVNPVILEHQIDVMKLELRIQPFADHGADEFEGLLLNEIDVSELVNDVGCAGGLSKVLVTTDGRVSNRLFNSIELAPGERKTLTMRHATTFKVLGQMVLAAPKS